MRRPGLAVLLATLIVAPVGAQQSSADPEIFLLTLSNSDGKIAVGKPVNITNRKGYDNQPAFSPKGRLVYYTSTRDDGQSDIYQYNIETRKTDRLTKTSESEYSATIMPSRERMSVVRVEKDSAQRLWSFALDGSDDRLLIKDIKPVGYHAWVDPFHLALFVLGTPNSLVYVNTRTGKQQVLAHDIGRSLLPLPAGHGFTFLAHHDTDWELTEVRFNGGNDSVRYTRSITTLPAGMEYVAWVGTTLIGGSGSKLFTFKTGGHWTELADLSADGLTHVSRIAVSPTGTMLAVVAEPVSAKP